MTYLSDKTRSRKNFKYYFLIVALVFLLVYKWPTFHYFLYPYIENVFIIYSNLKKIPLNVKENFSKYISSHDKLYEYNKKLLLNIENLENKLADRDAFLKEKGLLEDFEGKNVLLMYPIARDITNIYSTLLLSRGFKDDIKKDSVVYLRGKQAVCKIIEIYEKTSLCKLLSASGEKIEGVSTSSVTLFLKGYGGGSFVAETSGSIGVSLGEAIYLKSDQNMKLGVITEIVKEDQDTIWRIYVKGEYNPVDSNIFYVDN